MKQHKQGGAHALSAFLRRFRRAIARIVKWEHKHHLIPHFVISCLFVFLLAKALFHRDNTPTLLYIYGAAVISAITAQFFVALFLYKDPFDIAQDKAERGILPLDNAHPYLVSCLVAVHNEEDIITENVRSMCAQTYANKEIIIVDDCSTDNTRIILRQLAQQYPITVIELEKNLGKKGALARAIEQSKGEIIAFTDSDSIWHKDAIANMAEIFRYHPDIGAISGHTRALNGHKNILTKVQDSWYEGQYSIRKAFESYFGAVTCVSGPLAVFRRDAIYNYIPAWEQDSFLGKEFRFATDRTLTGFVLGAASIGQRLKDKYHDSPFVAADFPIKNYRVVYTKAARALTEVPDRFNTVFKQQVRWKKSFIRNMFFTGSFYWQKPAVAAVAYYLHIAFVFFGPFIVMRHVIYSPIKGNLGAAALYILGVVFIGYMFGLAYKLENPDSRRWIYRPLMSLFSTLVLSWIVFYSASTIHKMKWHRG